jgi:predicted MFS family arabinose efflux permease
MIVALTLPRFLDRFSDRPLMLAGGVLLAFGLFLGLSEPGFSVLLLIWTMLGMGGSLIQTPAGRLLKRSVHDVDRPSLFAFQFAISHACWLITYPLAGWIGGTFSLMAAFLVFGVLSVIATGMALLLWPTDDPIELEHTHEEMSHSHRHIHDEHHQHSHQGSEGPEPHHHPHTHASMKHTHVYVIDLHHPDWPIAESVPS